MESIYAKTKKFNIHLSLSLSLILTHFNINSICCYTKVVFLYGFQFLQNLPSKKKRKTRKLIRADIKLKKILVKTRNKIERCLFAKNRIVFFYIFD
jgi:hypothetical protein